MNSAKRSTTQPVRYMFIDDDHITGMALQRAMKKLGLSNQVEVAESGIEALEKLQAAVDSHGSLPPYIVTLDLNMPKMSGLEFLDKIRSSEDLNKLVVFVLTTSDAPSDIKAAYEKNVAGYILKEDNIDTFVDALTMIRDYSERVELPD